MNPYKIVDYDEEEETEDEETEEDPLREYQRFRAEHGSLSDYERN